MGLTKNRLLIVITLLLFIETEQWAQNPSPVPWPWQYGTEILNLEQRLANPAISAYERYDSLVRLARLRQLSGNISGAAANWLDAAAVNPNDDNALVSGAYCLTAIGEWERAYQTIQPLIASSRRSPAVLQAFYLDAYLKTWSSSNASPLAALAGDPGFVSLRPTLYYTLWQILTRNPNISGAANADFWKARLLVEYPGSPEALIAGSGNPSISAVQSPMWLLFPGAPVPGSTPIRPTIIPPSTMPPPSAQIVQIPQSLPAPNTPATRVIIQQPSQTPPQVAPPPVAQPVSPPPQPAPPPPTVLPPVNAPSTGGVLQTGSFSREANAHTQAEALRRAGFTATVSSKIVNGAVWWAVRVPAGPNVNKTMQDLKKAGFDSYLIK
jgi:cell division septation protein DedD